MSNARHPTAAKCPICAAATQAAYRPFCSRRCADIDLGRWLTGGYAIAESDADEQAEVSAQSDDENVASTRERERR